MRALVLFGLVFVGCDCGSGETPSEVTPPEQVEASEPTEPTEQNAAEALPTEPLRPAMPRGECGVATRRVYPWPARALATPYFLFDRRGGLLFGQAVGEDRAFAHGISAVGEIDGEATSIGELSLSGASLYRIGDSFTLFHIDDCPGAEGLCRMVRLLDTTGRPAGESTVIGPYSDLGQWDVKTDGADLLVARADDGTEIVIERLSTRTSNLVRTEVARLTGALLRDFAVEGERWAALDVAPGESITVFSPRGTHTVPIALPTTCLLSMHLEERGVEVVYRPYGSAEAGTQGAVRIRFDLEGALLGAPEPVGPEEEIFSNRVWLTRTPADGGTEVLTRRDAVGRDLGPPIPLTEPGSVHVSGDGWQNLIMNRIQDSLIVTRVECRD